MKLINELLSIENKYINNNKKDKTDNGITGNNVSFIYLIIQKLGNIFVT